MALSDYRSRLFVMTPMAWPDDLEVRAERVFEGGDIGCLLINGAPDQARAQALCSIAQAHDIAVLITDDTQLAGRIGADGLHLSAHKTITDEQIEQRQRQGGIVGSGGINTRHLALEVGERGFDYLFFGRTDRPIDEETHPKTLTLATWWAEVMAVPCVAIAGTSDDAFEELALAGVEFIAVRDQVWDAAGRVKQLNATLDAVAQKRMNEAA